MVISPPPNYGKCSCNMAKAYRFIGSLKLFGLEPLKILAQIKDIDILSVVRSNSFVFKIITGGMRKPKK